MLLGPSSSSVHCDNTKDHQNYQMSESQQTASDSEDGLTNTDVQSQRGFSHLCWGLLRFSPGASMMRERCPICRPCWGVRAHNSHFSNVCVSCLVMSDSLQPHSPPGPSIHGILQARTLEWVAISFSKRNYRKKVRSLSHVQLFVTPWTVAYQAPPSMEFSGQEYWSGLPLPSPMFLQ